MGVLTRQFRKMASITQSASPKFMVTFSDYDNVLWQLHTIDGLVDVSENQAMASLRCSSMRCKYPFNQSHFLLTGFALQLGHAAFRPAPLPMTRKRIARRLPELTPPTHQHVLVDPTHTPPRPALPLASVRRAAASLTSLGDCLRDKPAT